MRTNKTKLKNGRELSSQKSLFFFLSRSIIQTKKYNAELEVRLNVISKKDIEQTFK